MNHLKAWGAGLLYIVFLGLIIGAFGFIVKLLHADHVVVFLLLTVGAWFMGTGLLTQDKPKRKKRVKAS